MRQPANLEFFSDKTVTLLGLGLLGRGVGDAAFLAKHCRHVIVTDMKTADELRPSVDALQKFKNITFILGKHDRNNFIGIDFVIKGAGVRLDNPYLAHAKQNGIPIYMSTALFASLSGLKVIGVTGTRGKTTTTYMIAAILEAASQKFLLGGNLRGVSTLALLETAHAFDIALLELDSWQLQGFDDLKLSPNIGVFTNFYPDHMNYYDGDMDQYLADKMSIFRHQRSDDVLVCSQDIKTLIDDTSFAPKPAGRWLVAGKLPTSFTLGVPGTHNLMNAALARTVGQALGFSDVLIDKTLHDFKAVEGRLQHIGRWQERDFYNDSNATTQEATLAAITSFPAEKTILIFGGADKGLPLENLVAYILTHKIRCVLLKGTGSDRILKEIPELKVVTSMKEAIEEATAISAPADTIVLSPAFASFGLFKNEYDRSDQFMLEVKRLAEKQAPCAL